MTWKAVKIGTCVSLVILIAAVIFRPNDNRILGDKLSVILEGLEKVEVLNPVNVRPKVAVGYVSCLDLFAYAKDVLEFQDAAEPPERITNFAELMQSYTYFFKHGAAAERFVENTALFKSLVEKAWKVPYVKHAIGGNAALMAARFAQEGCDVLLASKMTSRLQEHMPKGIKIVGGDVQIDDVHLILEYKADEQWGPYFAPRANRFIIHNDHNNPTLSSLEDLDRILDSFEPDLLVVSGLQMMDNYPFAPGVRESRIKLVGDQMKQQKPTTRIHFEFASFAEPKLMKTLIQEIVPFADSLGMNEQELANLKSVLAYGNVSFASDCNPRVATALDDMRQIFRLIRESSSKVPSSRNLTRIHVHTLAYQAILTVKESTWKNAPVAAAKASLTAYRHVCGSTSVNIDKARLIMDESFSTSLSSNSRRIPLNLSEPVSCWDEEDSSVEGGAVNICVAPVLVCTDVKQTAGGGDNISSAGIAVQI